MKILKPGKVEQRKFVCPKCGCVFVATENEKYLAHDDCYQAWMEVQCPCYVAIKWDKGEPYEEHGEDSIERLADMIYDCRVSDAETAWEVAAHLIANGVTFTEGKP